MGRFLLPSLLAIGAVRAQTQGFVSGDWSLVQQGVTGVSAMQFAIVSETHAIILDKNQHNPLMVNNHSAWAAELNLNTRSVRPLNPKSNTFCATGSFMGNGTLVSTAGNPMQHDDGENGLQAVRLFTPCDDESCDIYEEQSVHRLTSPRWYPSSVRVEDGSVLIVGGSTTLTFFASDETNNPTYEFYPPKNIHGLNGLAIHSPFLVDAMFANQFPIVILLPDGNVFMACNTLTMLYNWRTNTERRLPDIPNGVRISSPFSGSGIMFPLTPENNYTPEVLICGGSTISDSGDLTTVSSQTPASSQCIRMKLTEDGIDAGWEIEQLPENRHMLDMVVLPDQRVLIINGAQTGFAAWGQAPDQVGESNADHPALQPVIYDPAQPAGSRFSTAGIPASPIPRMYHSIASLTPNGTIIVAGSAPNVDVSFIHFATEYRMEWLSPPYMLESRPSYTGLPAIVNYNETFTLSVNLPANTTNVFVALIDLGFITHGVHMDQRYVKLVSTLSEDGTTLTVTGPPTPGIYPPGPGFVYVVTEDGVPSFGHKLLIGTGESPPVDEAANANLLANTTTVPNDPAPSDSVPFTPPGPTPTYGTGY